VSAESSCTERRKPGVPFGSLAILTIGSGFARRALRSQAPVWSIPMKTSKRALIAHTIAEIFCYGPCMSRESSPLKGLILFFRDLRVEDHEGVSRALAEGGRWGAFFISPHECGKRLETVESLDFSAAQVRFQAECREELKHRLEALGIEILEKSPEERGSWLERLAEEHPKALLLRGRCYNARDEAVVSGLLSHWDARRVRVLDQGTLFREEDLPFALEDLPATFTPFHRKLKKEQVSIRSPLSPVQCRSGRPEVPNGTPRGSSPALAKGFLFRGGEAAAHARIEEYFTHSRAVGHYRETRNGMLEWNDSSKLSPYLAAGCLSARQVNEAIDRYEKRWGATESTEALRYELVWRDYFKFLSLRFGARIFSERGVRDREMECVRDREKFLAWARGETGNDFIDANLRELRETGWMSNRGRQNVASFLARTLKLPWIWGAEWFQARLLDYDPETNWGNWMYLAGVGTDPRDRVFNPDLQAQVYDTDGKYRARWLAP
jgi:deoxyribodipyrimidine photo-lyase